MVRRVGRWVRHRLLSSRAKRLSILLLNLLLLTGGIVALAAAVHFYFLAEENIAKNTIDSLSRAEGNRGSAILWSVMGVIPLGLGVRGEVKRKLAADRRAARRAARKQNTSDRVRRETV